MNFTNFTVSKEKKHFGPSGAFFGRKTGLETKLFMAVRLAQMGACRKVICAPPQGGVQTIALNSSGPRPSAGNIYEASYISTTRDSYRGHHRAVPLRRQGSISYMCLLEPRKEMGSCLRRSTLHMQDTPISIEHALVHHFAQRRMREYGVYQFCLGRFQRLANRVTLDQFGHFCADHVSAQ